MAHQPRAPRNGSRRRCGRVEHGPRGVAAGPAGEPDTAWLTRVLAGAPPPDGARADPTGAEPAATLCTFVADLTGGEAFVLPLGGAPVTIPVADLARGNAGAQRPGP